MGYFVEKNMELNNNEPPETKRRLLKDGEAKRMYKYFIFLSKWT